MKPGSAKTALLHDVTASLVGVRVLCCDGFEAESGMPYSALQRLGRPLARRLGRPVPD